MSQSVLKVSLFSQVRVSSSQTDAKKTGKVLKDVHCASADDFDVSLYTYGKVLETMTKGHFLRRLMSCDASSKHLAVVPSGDPGVPSPVKCNSCNWTVTRQLFSAMTSPEIGLALGLVSGTTCDNTK